MDKKILIIGASGFIGSHLLQKFENDNREVMVLARSPHKVLTTSNKTKVISGDLEKIETLEDIISKSEVIYYLAHGMNETSDHFLEKEKLQALNLSKFLTKKQRVIYLGGIIPNSELSEHLKSREIVGTVLRESEAQVIEFRASIVIGQGSASFEMIRALVARLPFILNAKWMHSRCQPIALPDALEYLTRACDLSLTQKNMIFDIGGAEQIPYGELVQRYAQSQGLFRPTINILDFPKSLASDLLKIVAPEYYEIGRKLLESIEHETTVQDEEAQKYFPFKPMGINQAIAQVPQSDLKAINFSELLGKLKQHDKLPQYLTGQVLQTFIEIPPQLDFYQIIEELNTSLPIKIPLKEEIEIKIPFTGELKLNYHKQKKGILLSYAPKYFFQSMGWVLWEQLLKSLREILVRNK